MPKILVVDDRIERTEYLINNLKGSANDPYEIEYVKNGAELKDKLDSDYHDLDMIVFDVDFSQLPYDELIHNDPPHNLDKKNQGYLLLGFLRKWEKEHNQERLIKAILVSAVQSSIVGREADIDKYSVETYHYSDSSPESPGLVNKILRLCPSINKDKIDEWKSYGIVCGKSRNMYELMCEAKTIAEQNCNVWIDGPTGSGKELMARFIHQKSPRSDDLGAILMNLIKELKQLDRIGTGVFGSKVATLCDKINTDITNSISFFKSINEEKKDEKEENNDKISEYLQSILSDFGVLDDIKQKIKEGIDYFKKRKNIVAKCLLQVAMLWRESQIRNDSKHGLFNFFDINCATFAEGINLLTDIFGNRAKAFTDVVDSYPGILKATSYMYGTLFLDEIGDLSHGAQAMLLRVLQEGEFKRIKSNITEKVNVRVIAATNKNINELIKSGSFRYDLYMRIAQARIQLPSLKERMDDFDELADVFLKRKIDEDKERGIDSEIRFDKNITLNFLKSQDQIWEGNIRALQNVVNRAYEMAKIEDSATIDIDHIRRTLHIFDGLVNQEVGKTQEQNYETTKDVVKQLLELIRTSNITETKVEDDKEISIDDIKLWLDKAFKRLDLNSCTNENLQDLIGHISKLFFLKAINSNSKIIGEHSRSHIAKIMGINPKQIHNNKQISTLKIKDLIDEINRL